VDIGTSTTERLFHAALDGLSARQRVISDNVANVDTPDFKASKVTFEGALKQASGTLKQPTLQMFKVQNAVDGPENTPLTVHPQTVTLSETTRRNDGNNVDIDEEMLDLTNTNISYNALIQATSSRLASLRYVVNDGRR
jgi:flagellar basal-body rod protein FlgB